MLCNFMFRKLTDESKAYLVFSSKFSALQVIHAEKNMQWLKDSDARCVVHNDRKKFKRLSRATLNWIDGVQNLIVYESSTQLPLRRWKN